MKGSKIVSLDAFSFLYRDSNVVSFYSEINVNVLYQRSRRKRSRNFYSVSILSFIIKLFFILYFSTLCPVTEHGIPSFVQNAPHHRLEYSACLGEKERGSSRMFTRYRVRKESLLIWKIARRIVWLILLCPLPLHPVGIIYAPRNW